MYSTLSNAYNRAVADNGGPESWDLSDTASLLKVLEPYLNVTERCYNKKGCVSKGNYVALSGESRYGNLYNYQNIAKLRLNGGFSVFVVSAPYNGCEYEATSTDAEGNPVSLHIKDDCGSIFGIITNTKDENRVNYFGKDYFIFKLTTKGLFPYGYTDKDISVKNYCSKKVTSNAAANGLSCGTWILRYDNMDYFYE